jgi:hypothetical protein
VVVVAGVVVAAELSRRFVKSIKLSGLKKSEFTLFSSVLYGLYKIVTHTAVLLAGQV